MYYSVLIEVTKGTGKNSKTKSCMRLNEPDLDKIIKEIVEPYSKKQEFFIDGYVVNKSIISRLKIVASEKTIEEIVKYKQNALQPGVFAIYTPQIIISSDNEFTQNITNDLLGKCSNPYKREENSDTIPVNDKVFIVHGHDEAIKYEVSNFLRRIGLEPIILHEQANRGQTIIEKIEEFSDVGFGIVLYTPCDKGGTAETDPDDMKLRARQNVIFEHGYLIGKLGRERVCALLKENVERPSDIDGILYIPYQKGMWELAVGKELRSAGYNIDLNCIC